MQKKKFDVAIIGSGPGGYVAAIRIAQRGFTTCLIEAQETGGTCLNRGCIPSKALIASAERLTQIHESASLGIYIDKLSFDYQIMAERKDKIVSHIRSNLESLIKANQITLLRGYAKLLSPNQIKVQGEEPSLIEADRIILATGSEPRSLPTIPFDFTQIHDSTSLLALKKLPKSLLIVGGGIIGCEFACLHRALGVEVTIVELLPSILSTEGKDVATFMTHALQKQGIRILTNSIVTSVDRQPNQLTVHLAEGKSLQAEQMLISVGRKYNSDHVGLEKAGILKRADGSIETNDQMQTNLSHIYAIGDVTGKSLLAHVASHQGLVAADHIAGHPAHMNYNAIPSVIFTHPEVATIGYTLEKAIAAGYEATLGHFPFLALGKSQASGQTEGFAQVVVNRPTGQILGAQVIGEGAANLIAEMAVAITGELTADSMHETIHAHPTTAEAWMEALFLANQLPLHLPPKKRASHG